MGKSIGALEFRSICKGIEVANEIVKIASVEIIYFKAICSGKFLVIVTGDEGAVNEAIDSGEDLADNTLIDSFRLHAISESIIQAFKNKYFYDEPVDAMGIMEAYKVCAGIKALDRTLKSGDVQLAKMQVAFAIGGKLVFVITGSMSSIEYGLKEGLSALDENEKAHISVIRSPSEDMVANLLKKSKYGG